MIEFHATPRLIIKTGMQLLYEEIRYATFTEVMCLSIFLKQQLITESQLSEPPKWLFY